MAKTARDTAQDGNERILDVAARLFRQRGYDATTVRDIARAAGILPGSLHYRYPSKEEVLVALMERAIDRLIAGVLAESAGASDPLERARLAIRAHLRLLLTGDDAVYVLLYDWRSLQPATAQALQRQRTRYERFADELIAQAALTTPVKPGVDLVLLRRFGFGAINWVAQWYEPNGPWTPDDIADHFWNYMANGALDSAGADRGADANPAKPRK